MPWAGQGISSCPWSAVTRSDDRGITKTASWMPTTWNNCFKTMDQANFSWMLWTYKATGHGMWSSDWCLFGSKDGFWRAKVKTDSFEEIAEKWGEKQQTQIGFQDSGHYDKNVKAFL